MDPSAILEWIKQMAGVGAPVRPFNPGNMGPGQYGAGPPTPPPVSSDPRFAGITPLTPPEGGYFDPSGISSFLGVGGPRGPQGPRGATLPSRDYSGAAGMAPQMTPGGGGGGAAAPMGPVAFPQPSSKTDQNAPLKFAWGGNEPEAYLPGVSDVLQMQGAPEGRQGFMGATPADPTQPGGFSPSAEWGDVANPQGFDAFAQAPAVAETLASAGNPMWRQQQEADIQQARDLAVGGGLMEKQSEIDRSQVEWQEERAKEAYNLLLKQREDDREVGGLPPMTEDEKNSLWLQVQSQMMPGADPFGK